MSIDFVDRHEAKQTERDYQQIQEAALQTAKDLPKALLNLLILLKNFVKSTQPAGVRIELGDEVKNQRYNPEAATRTAQTAAQLLDRYGTTEGQEKVYRADSYTIRSGEHDGTSITDRQGNLLMKLKDGQTPEIQLNNMTSRQMRDFTRVHDQLHRNGFAEELETRIRQLRNLAPVADLAPAREVRNLAAVTSAQRVLDSIGKDSYENESYWLERQGEAFTVTAKDGRGVIARTQEGVTTGRLSASDMIQVDQLERQIRASEQPPNLGRQEAVVFNRLMSTGNYTPHNAKVLAEEAVASAPSASSEVKELAYSKETAEGMSKLRLPQGQVEKTPRRGAIAAPSRSETIAPDKDIEIGD